MRIIAGERRGHKIDGPKGGDTRPTSDLVRRVALQYSARSGGRSRRGRLVRGDGRDWARSISRGARAALFVERNRDNVGLIYRNATVLRYEDRVRVLATSAYRWARAFTPVDDEPMVVLLDPPYREYEVNWKKVNQLLTLLVEKLPAGSVVVVESGKLLGPRVLPEFEAWDVRRYGGTQVGVRIVPERDEVVADQECTGPTDDVSEPAVEP